MSSIRWKLFAGSIVGLAAFVASPATSTSQGKPAENVAAISLTPASITAGSSGRQLVIRGSGFTSKSQVRVDGEHRTTTYRSSSEIRGELLAADLDSAKSLRVTVFTPGSGSSNSLELAVVVPVAVAPPPPPPPPAPTMTITGMRPVSVIPGSKTLNMGVAGTGFTDGMIVRFNGANRITSFLLPTVLSVVIPSGDVATAGTGQITVFNPATGATTPPFPLYIDDQHSLIPSIHALSRTSGVAGTTFRFTINGTNFVGGVIGRFNGVNIPVAGTSQNGPGILAVEIPASMTATPGIYRVTVFNAGPGGGESNALNFTLTPP